jgi:hypothetical protein
MTDPVTVIDPDPVQLFRIWIRTDQKFPYPDPQH